MAKKKLGRPEDYRKDFHPAEFIRHSKDGKNKTQIAALFEVHRDTLYEWAKKHKTFSDAIKKGSMLCEAHWMNLGYAGMTGGVTGKDGKKIQINLGFYVWLTKNNFGWSDTPEPQHEDNTLELSFNKYEKPS